MNRRDFLLFRIDDKRRVVELSCERLYMQYLDAQLTWGPQQDPAVAEGSTWGGEPPAEFEPRSVEQLFANVERDLESADVLVIAEPRWLASEPLQPHLETLIASFRARGGRVELANTAQFSI